MDEHKDIIEQPFLAVFKNEWRFWILGAIVSFFAASLFISGWPNGLIPNTTIPFTYSGDGISYLWNIKRVIEEAWYFNNSHTGYPFGSNHLDYPTADTGSYLILKVLGLLFQSPVAALNLYYLLGFSTCFAASYIVARTLGITRALALVGAVLYTFASFHFGRIGHLFFTWYFVAPLFFYYGLRLFSRAPLYQFTKGNWINNTIHTIILMALASFGIYYALFGCIVLLVCACLSGIYQRSWRHVYTGFEAIFVVALGVLLNVAPSLWHIAVHGQNREGVERLAAESELYGLKLIQLLLPRGDHRLLSFFEFSNKYNSHFPLVTENASASMGLLAAGGFIALLAIVFASNFIKNSDQKSRVGTIQAGGTYIANNLYIDKLQVLGVVALSLFLMATVGGFASLFALTVSASIRSWNRISIFIEFASITGFVLLVDGLLARYSFFTKPIYKKILLYIVAVVLMALGIWDQTAKPCVTCLMANQTLFVNDKQFIQRVEKSLPEHAAIYQLPYMAYPEYGAVNGLGSYDQARGHVHSNQLNWSFGGIRGREGDWFYRQLAQLPISQQITVARAMGFSGIYVDARGYLNDVTPKRCAAFISESQKNKNNCVAFKEIKSSLEKEIGPDLSTRQIISEDKQLVFFPLGATSAESQKDYLSSANAYLKAVGFAIMDGMPKFVGGMTEVVDFRKVDLPLFVTGVSGLSGLSENTNLPLAQGGQASGRWTDAIRAPRVTLWLAKPLPESFSLTLRARAGGPNASKPLQIKVGKQVKEMTFGAEMSSQTVSFDGVQGGIQKIEFKPFEPFVPARRWGGDDMRMVGVEFEQLSFLPK